MVALVDGQPKLLNLKELLEAFLRHRREVVTRRTVFELRKARERAHILEGLAVALANIDEVIALIKASPTPGRGEGRADGARLGAGRRDRDAGARRRDATRPEDWPTEFGLRDGLPAVARRRPRRSSICACTG